MKNILLIATFLLSSSVLLWGQRANGSLGIGAQFGQPTGLSLKIYQPEGISPDVLLAWDLDDFFFINVHGLFERHLGSTENFHYFIGPGLFAGFHDRNKFEFGAEDFSAGISGNFGLNLIVDRIEFYGQITPRLELIEETSGAVGGGLGIRFYFGRIEG